MLIIKEKIEQILKHNLEKDMLGRTFTILTTKSNKISRKSYKNTTCGELVRSNIKQKQDVLNKGKTPCYIYNMKFPTLKEVLRDKDKYKIYQTLSELLFILKKSEVKDNTIVVRYECILNKDETLDEATERKESYIKIIKEKIKKEKYIEQKKELTHHSKEKIEEEEKVNYNTGCLNKGIYIQEEEIGVPRKQEDFSGNFNDNTNEEFDVILKEVGITDYRIRKILLSGSLNVNCARVSGDYNYNSIFTSGDCNIGSYNSGSYNIGNYNSGYFNRTNYSSGLFNTQQPPVYIANTEITNKESLLFFNKAHKIISTNYYNIELENLKKLITTLTGKETPLKTNFEKLLESIEEEVKKSLFKVGINREHINLEKCFNRMEETNLDVKKYFMETFNKIFSPRTNNYKKTPLLISIPPVIFNKPVFNKNFTSVLSQCGKMETAGDYNIEYALGYFNGRTENAYEYQILSLYKASTKRPNVGNKNFGKYNIGNKNISNGNIGNGNINKYNIGNKNVGHYNIMADNCVGCFNSCNNSVGFFNTIEQHIYMFNKPTDITLTEAKKTDWFKILMTVPKDLLYKIDFKNWYNNLSDVDKNTLQSMPNFNKKIFEDILFSKKVGD